ncbi:MAG: antibiotic biosynthesis monooxygenase [Bacteroidetes bacterium]|nr:antibiotic biosynthesis monooxygenase [Bacteroidota bacterium]
MIKRIVKMTFKPEEVDNFLKLIDHVLPLIEQMEGCRGVKLYSQEGAKNVMFTLSLWDNNESLEKYRASDLFKTTWTQTKRYFSDKPQAWSINQIR